MIFPIRWASRNEAGFTPGFVKSSAHLSNGLSAVKNRSKNSLFYEVSSSQVFFLNREKPALRGKKLANVSDQPMKPGASICLGSLIIEPRALLSIINEIFETNCQDLAAIDASGTWAVIVEEMSPHYQSALTLAVRFHPAMKLSEAGKILGVSVTCVHQRCERAIRQLRDPRRLNRIQNSIVGLANLYRDQMT